MSARFLFTVILSRVDLLRDRLRRSAFLFQAVAACAAVFFFSTCRNEPARRVISDTPATGISKVELRAWKASAATIIVESRATIEVSGTPAMAANGYHDPDPAGHETAPDQMPFEFNVGRYGSVAVVSCKGEVAYAHHHYYLDGLEVRLPAGIEVVPERQALRKAVKVATMDYHASERRESDVQNNARRTLAFSRTPLYSRACFRLKK